MNSNFQPGESQLEDDPEKTQLLPDLSHFQKVFYRPINKHVLEQEQKAQFALSWPIPAKEPGELARSHQKSRFVHIGSIVGLLVLLAGGAAFGIWRHATSAPNVTLYQVGAPHNIDLPIGGGGIAYPQQQLDISYPVAERVVNLKVKVGDHVSPNQSLIQLDPTQLNAALQQSSDDMAAALAYLNSISASGTALNIAQAQQDYDIARSKYNALLAQTTSPFLRDGSLISPMKGVITAVNVNAGQVFSANTTLLTIMDESNMVVHTKIPLANLGQVYLNQPALITPSALANVNLPGTVTNIIPQADPQTDTFEAWISVANDKSILLPGMSAFTRIQSSTKAMTVPRLAVLYPSGNAAVYVVRNGVAHLQRIQISGHSVDSIYVTGGLSAGDSVVLVGLDGLQDGRQINIMNIQRSAS